MAEQKSQAHLDTPASAVSLRHAKHTFVTLHVRRGFYSQFLRKNQVWLGVGVCLLCVCRVASSCKRTTVTFPGVCPTRGVLTVRRGNGVGGSYAKVMSEV